MTISFRITAEDLAAFSEHVVFTRYRRLQSARAFWMGIVLGVLAAIFLYSQVHEPITSVIAALIFAGVVAWLLPKAERDLHRKRTLRLYASGRDASIGEHNLTFDEAGIHCTCSTGSSTTTWTAVNFIELTPAYLFVFLGPAKAIVIPRSFVSDPGAVETALRGFAKVPFAGSWRNAA